MTLSLKIKIMIKYSIIIDKNNIDLSKQARNNYIYYANICILVYKSTDIYRIQVITDNRITSFKKLNVLKLH